MPKTETNDSLQLANVQIDELLTMGAGAQIDVPEIASAATPDSGMVRLYAKTDGLLYMKDDAGTETCLDADTAGAVMKVLFDANTVLAATSDNTPAAVTVAEQRVIGRKTGGNIAALTASEVLGVLAGSMLIIRQSGRWYDCGPFGNGRYTTSALTIDADTVYAVPFFAWGTTFQAIGAEIITAPADKGIKLGIYAMGTDGLPAAREYAGSTISIATNGLKSNTSIAQTPTPGWHYLALLTDADSATIRALLATGLMPMLGSADGLDHAGTYLTKASQTYAGGLPDPFPAGPTFATGNLPRIMLQVS